MERPSINRSICFITFNIVQIVNSHFRKIVIGCKWEDICKLFDISLLENSFTVVKWLRPPLLFVKVNSDGSCINGNCGVVGWSGIVLVG